jgi:hypothetical protein
MAGLGLNQSGLLIRMRAEVRYGGEDGLYSSLD